VKLSPREGISARKYDASRRRSRNQGEGPRTGVTVRGHRKWTLDSAL